MSDSDDKKKEDQRTSNESSTTHRNSEKSGGLWFFRAALLVAIAIPLLPFLAEGYRDLAFCNRNLSGRILMFVLLPHLGALLVTFMYQGKAVQRFSSALVITWAIMVIPIAVLYGNMPGSPAVLSGLVLISQFLPFITGIGLLTQAKPEPGTKGRPAFGGVTAAVAFGIVVLVILIPQALSSAGMGSGESASVGTMRLIGSCAYGYQTNHPKEGWPSSLEQIGPSCDACIDSTFLEATTPTGKPKYGYRFTYTPGEPNSEGVVETFTLTGAPVICGCAGVRTYFIDEILVLRFTSDPENNCPVPTATSPPL